MAGMETPAKWKGEPAKDAVFTIVPNTEVNGKDLIKDIAGKNKTTIAGATLGKDAEMGDYVDFGAEGKTGISIKYEGGEDVLKGRGFTLEAWIKPEPGALKKAAFMWQNGFGSTSFKDDKMNIDWLSMPTEPIYTEPGTKQYNYYPMAWGMGGFNPLKMSEWNHLLIVYDENLKVLRTWINGKIDRDNELLRDGQQWLKLSKADISFFRDVHNCKVAGIRLLSGAYPPDDAPLMKVYLNQLPWKGEMVFTADKIDPQLKLPIEIVVTLEGVANGVYRKSFNSHDTAHVVIPMPESAPAMRTMNIKVSAAGKQVYSTSMNYCSILPKPNTGVSINPDKSFSLNGKKIFPLFIYHVKTEDLPAVKKMGFNIVSGKDFKGRWDSLPARELEDCLAYAKAVEDNKLFLTFGSNVKDANFEKYMGEYKNLPSLFIWYCADEPWRNFDVYQKNYNSIRSFDPNHPVITVVNNTMHMKNAGPICDIMGCDPYPIPNVSLRNVSDMTESSSKSTFGLKPVWTVLPAYESKLPTLAELRCMTALAICAGTNGIGIYSWDDRLQRKGKWVGYHMPQYPETIKIVSTLIHELLKIEQILVEPNIPDAVSVNPEQLALHAAVKKSGGKQYLFLANDSRKEQAGTITLKSGKTGTAKPISIFGYDKPIKFTAGKCQISLPAIAAGVFELSD
jgi:hypothetical protein